MNQEFNWYIAPNGCPVTNRLLSERLSPADECPQKLCADGEERDLWRCDHALVTEFKHARNQLNLTFKVFVQEGANGKIRPWRFAKKMHVRKAVIA